MFVPQDGSVALPMMFLLLILWGSWPACRKMGGSANIDFEMVYVVIQVVVSIVLCASFGMAVAEDFEHFDNSDLISVMAKELQRKPAAVALSLLAGVFLCIGDFVMACAIDLLGVTIACPLGFGIPLTLGSCINYAIEPKADPRLLFPGVVCCLCGMLLDTASHANRKEEVVTGSSPGSMLPVQYQQGTCATTMQPLPVALQKEPGEESNPIEVVANARKEQDQGNTHWNWRHLLVPIFGGSCCCAAGPICTAAGALGGLDPYVIQCAFMVGQLCTVLPLLSMYAVLVQPKSLEASTSSKIPFAILKHVLASIQKAPRSFFWNAMAGVCTGTGWFLFQVGTPVVSRAVGFIFGCSSPLTCVFYGVFIFHEFHGQPLRAKLYSAFATFFFGAAIALMSYSS